MLRENRRRTSSAGHPVTAFDDSLAHAADRFAHIGNPDEMQFDRVPLLLRVFENVHIRSATQRRFGRESFMAIY